MIESTGILGAEEARQIALERLEVPASYSPRGVARREHNGRQLWHFRYEKASGQNCGLGGEHFSFTVDVFSGEILGTTWMDGRFSSAGLPGEEEARAEAKRFLCRAASGLKEEVTVLWVDRHDETIIAAGEETLVSGTKVKMRRDGEGDYAWVIVGRGADGRPEVVTFERDIVWNSAAGHRATQFWLSDEYLAENIAEHHPMPAKFILPPTNYGTVADEGDHDIYGGVGAFDERGVA